MNDTILKADNLYFSYDNDKSHSLNGLSLEIKRGTKVALMGANGSGKSTFFLCCNGIHKPSGGTLCFNGQPVDYSKKGLLELRSKVGIVFQDPDDQLFSASVSQEISFGILNLGLSEEKAKKEVDAVIESLEITPFRDKPTHALSGGQKKQVSIADILVMHPEIVILDEPSAALDPKHTAKVNQIVDKLTEEGITVMMSTHDVDYALSWADDVILFREGKVLLQGPPIQVFSDKSVLAQTNLEQPAVMQIFERLCRKGVLSDKLPQPKNLEVLESYIEEMHVPATYSNGTALHMDQNADPVINNQAHSKETGKYKKQKAILIVSFGTSHTATREVTIDAIERDMRSAYPDCPVYTAWTSKKIIARIQSREGIHIDNVAEAMERIHMDGITDVFIQPTHVINGIENETMKEDALMFQNCFHSISFGSPLLTSADDSKKLIQIINNEFKSLESDSCLVLMGHGTTHYANSIYAALDYQFKDSGYPNVFLGTVEAYPDIHSLLKQMHALHPKKIILAPFMIVAGDHAANDMAGDTPDSWRSQFEQAGYEVECVMKGLGEYPGVRQLLIEHLKSLHTLY